MTVQLRPYSGAGDLQRMAQLALLPQPGYLHAGDLPYRLSSWALDYAENVGLWEDEAGQLLAWAVLQTPFWAIDYAVHPGADANMLAEVLAWVGRRAGELREQPSGRPMWFAHVREDQLDQRRELERAGFRSIEHDPESPWSGMYLRRPGDMPVPVADVPVGFAVRPLRGRDEIAAYVELHRTVFGSTNMTEQWRARTLQQPLYLPELDLVVKAPNGELVAFCICWATAYGPQLARLGQVEPLGVHPAYRELGLGRAVLLEGVRRLQQLGVEAMLVLTDDDRDAAVALYRAAGFVNTHKVLIYRLDAEQHPAADA